MIDNTKLRVETEAAINKSPLLLKNIAWIKMN